MEKIRCIQNEVNQALAQADLGLLVKEMPELERNGYFNLDESIMKPKI